MLTRVRCEGYKAFSQSVEIELTKINVVFGRNNSGKTSLARLPQFLLSMLSDNAFGTGNDPTYAQDFLNVASSDQAHPRIEGSLGWQNHNLSCTIQHIASADEPDRLLLTSLDLDGDESILLITDAELDGRTPFLLRMMDTGTRRSLRSYQSQLRRLAKGAVHVSSSRPTIEVVYDRREPAGWTTEEVPYWLAKDPDLAERVSAWMERNSLVSGMGIEESTFSFRVVARGQPGTLNFAHVGRGTQAVLPVVTMLLAVVGRTVTPTVLVIEEPEAHLHPSVHAALADLVIAAAARVQLIVETHSENFVLRLRRRVAEKSLSAEDLNLQFVDADHSVRRIEIDHSGIAHDWPSGVFESDIQEAAAILEARIESLRDAG